MVDYGYMEEAQPSLSSETLRLLSYCPLCEKQHQGVDAHVLGSEGDICVWHIRCRACHHALLAMVLKNKELVSTVGIVTDLSVDDVHRVMNQKSVSLNDVLRAHQAFAKPEYLKKLIQEK